MDRQKRADKRAYHYLYKITRFDGKYYYGIHSTDNLEDGYFGSGTYLWKSIHKHGKEAHSKEIIEFCSSREEVKDREKYLVNRELLEDRMCMNLKPGGEGGGGFWSDEQAKNFYKAGQKAMMSKKDHSAGSKVGWQRHRDKLLENTRKASAVGLVAMLSQESRDKRKKTMSENGHQVGAKNSNFGKTNVCMHKDGVTRRFSKDVATAMASEGWMPGFAKRQ